VTDHDQLFKSLFQEFFGDLLRIVAPELAARLRVEHPELLESELFTSFPEGKRRHLDLVVRVESVEGEPEVVLVHVEVERQARKAMGLRLLDYAMQLWLKHHQPVVPIVVYLRGGKEDVTREELRLGLFGQSFFTFSYLAFGLSRSQADEYLARPEPLSWGLAGLMRRGKLSAALHRLSCLEPMTRADLTDKQRFLLVNLVETYIQLDEAEQGEYEALLAARGHEEVAAMEMTWAGKIAHEARETALREGLQKGREEGKRDLLLDLLEHRFGRLPRVTVNRVNALTSSEELSRLAARVLDAPSLEDLGL
jgi:predicted transposase YdaD